MFWLLSIIAILAFAAGPMLIQYNHWSLGYRGSGDWLSFWGSYLGVVPSGIIAALVAGVQIKESNKQNHENAMQNLNAIKNTKLLNYYYEIKNSSTKSFIILKGIKSGCDIEALYTFLCLQQRQAFNVVNLQTLLQENNLLHLNVKVVNADNSLNKLSEALMEYSGNLVLVERMMKLYAATIDENRNVLENEIDEELEDLYTAYTQQSTHKKIMEQLLKMIDLIDEKIKDLSA